MAHMTPPSPPLWRPGWFAEKNLFEALQAGLGDDWQVFHDYAFLGRERPAEGAIDFLVVYRERGMLAIECKGDGVHLRGEERDLDAGAHGRQGGAPRGEPLPPGAAADQGAGRGAAPQAPAPDAKKYDITVKVNGGGVTGQTEAVRLGLSRALMQLNGDWISALRKGNGLLTRDARVKERKKPGLKKARKAPTYTKR